MQRILTFIFLYWLLIAMFNAQLSLMAISNAKWILINKNMAFSTLCRYHLFDSSSSTHRNYWVSVCLCARENEVIKYDYKQHKAVLCHFNAISYFFAFFIIIMIFFRDALSSYQSSFYYAILMIFYCLNNKMCIRES